MVGKGIQQSGGSDQGTQALFPVLPTLESAVFKLPTPSAGPSLYFSANAGIQPHTSSLSNFSAPLTSGCFSATIILHRNMLLQSSVF